MPKIMLVEDDKSLREIYSIRLVAEGYDVVSAGDGEEALALAVQQKPDLILSDVMMPKISGFDMLDILRSTPETKDIKVIMMTALSSEEQRQRGESLGADKYLVKSQVGIEDVINAVHEVMGDKGGAAPAEAAPAQAAPATATAEPTPGATAEVTPAPAAPTSEQPAQPVAPAQPEVAASPEASAQPAVAQAEAPIQVAQPAAPIQPADTAQTDSAAQPAAPAQSSTAEQMEAILNEDTGVQNANWPGTAAQ